MLGNLVLVDLCGRQRDGAISFTLWAGTESASARAGSGAIGAAKQVSRPVTAASEWRSKF